MCPPFHIAYSHSPLCCIITSSLRLSATVEAQIRNKCSLRHYLPPLPPPPLPLPLPDAPPELPPELELELPELLEPLLLGSLFAAPSLESPPRSDPLCSVDEPAEPDLVPVWVQPESPKAMLPDKTSAATIYDSLFMLYFLPSCGLLLPSTAGLGYSDRNPCATNKGTSRFNVPGPTFQTFSEP